MSQVDLLLMNPPIKKVSTSYRSKGTPPLALAYLAAVSEKNGYSVECLDLNLHKKGLSLSEYVIDKNPKVVGITFVTEQRFEAFQLFKQIKSINPNLITVAGGPHVTLCAEDTLRHINSIDYIVRGEGEITFIELLNAIFSGNSRSMIKGVSYINNGEIVHTPDRVVIKNLDELPYPAMHLLSFEDYNFHIQVEGYGEIKAAPILSSRGCPFKCNFCACTKIWGAMWRFRSPEHVIAEIRYLKDKYRINAIWFVDDNFNVNRKRMYSICERIVHENLDIKWICNVRVDNLKKEDLELMSKSGCISIEFGAESGSQNILDKVVHKKITVDQIKRADEWCYQLGIKSDAQFIISHPYETTEDANKTMELMKSLKGQSTLQILKVYPGTEVEKIAYEIGLLPPNFSWALDKGNSDIIPSITGNAPLFFDKLTVNEVSSYMTTAWIDIRSFALLKIINKVVKKIRSPKEFISLMKMGFLFVFKKVFGGIKYG